MSPQGLLHRVEEVAVALGCLADQLEQPEHLGAITLCAQLRQTRPLLLLDERVHAQRLVVLVLVDRELVHADDRTDPAVDLLGDLVGRSFDLGLLEALLDRSNRAAHLGDARDERECLSLDLVGHRLDDIRTGEGIDGGADIGLVGQHLLGAERKASGLLRWQRYRLIEGIRVEGLRSAKHCREALHRNAHKIDLRLLGGELHASRLGMEAQHP